MDLDTLQDATFASATPATRNSYPIERRLGGAALAGYLDRRVFAVLSTTRVDGRPHAALVSYLRRGTNFWMPTVEGSVRARNISAHPWGVLVVSHGDRDEHVAVIVEGPVAAIALEEAPDDVRGSRDGDWVQCWLQLEGRRLLSYGAPGAVA